MHSLTRLRQLSAGLDGIGVALTYGRLAIAVVDEDGPNRTWYAVQGTGLGGSLTLPEITATISEGILKLNGASGALTPLTWATDLDLDGDGVFGEADPARPPQGRDLPDEVGDDRPDLGGSAAHRG